MEFDVGGLRHRARPLNAYEQFRLLRTITPLLPALGVIDPAGRMDPGNGLAVLASMQGLDLAAIFAAAAEACEKLSDGGAWEPASKALPVAAMLDLVLTIVCHHFTAYFALHPPTFMPIPPDPIEFDPVRMPDGEDWFWRPCRGEAPLIPFMAAFDGSARIEHFAKANHLLDVEAENAIRMRRSLDKAR